MSSPMLRRTFLVLAAAAPLALRTAILKPWRDGSEATLEEALRRLVFAVGPWPEVDLASAEDFFARFWNAVPASGSYRQDAELLRRLSERFPSGTHAAEAIDLSSLPASERELLVQLSDGLYGLFEIRTYVAGEPPYGICATDRSRYVREPGA